MKRWIRAGLGALLLAGLVAGGAQAQKGKVGTRLYVTNQDDATVSVVDLAGRKVIKTIDLKTMGFGPNAKPHHVQVEPDGRYWYLTLIGAGKLLKFDRNDKIVGSVDLEVPGLISLSPTDDLMMVAKSMSAVNPPKRIALVRRSDMKLLDEYDTFFPRPHGNVISPRGDYVYVASLGANQLASIRIKDGEIKLVDVDGPPHTFTQLAVSPDARWLSVTAQTTGQLMVFDLADPATPTLTKMVDLGGGPFESIFSHDGKLVFVTNLAANEVDVLDTSGWKVIKTIQDPGLSQPHGLALSPDGRFVWVSNRFQSGGAHDHEGMRPTGNGTLVAICIPTLTVESVLEVGHYAAGVGAPVPGVRPETPSSCQ